MNTRLTKIKDTEILSAVPESGHVMAEVDGVVKRVPGNKVGGVPDGAKEHQYLAADKNGKAKWRDPLAYKFDKPQTQYIDADGDINILCKVSDDIPEPPSEGMGYVIIYDNAQQEATGYIAFDDDGGYSLFENYMIVVKKAGAELPGHAGVVFPETGIYMQKIIGYWHTQQVTWDGFSISWDGVTENVKPMPANGLAENPAPYKQLVTDASGKTVWEDRLAYKTGDKVLVNEKSVMLEGDIMPEGNVDADAYDDIIEGIPYYVKFTSEYNNYDGYVEASKLENGNVGLKFSCSDSGFKVRVWKIDEKTFRVSLSSVPVPTKITISISAPGSIKPIDPPFLGGWKALGEGEPVKTAIAENVSFTLVDMGSGMYAQTNLFDITPVAGQTYLVTWDGVEYECVAYDLADFPGVAIIGNATLGGLNGGNGEPFMILNTETVMVAGQDANTHTISVYVIAPQIIPVPSEYLPLATSETPGAIKVYDFPNSSVLRSEMEKAVADFQAGRAVINWNSARLIYAKITDGNLYYAYAANPGGVRKCEDLGGGYNNTIWEKVPSLILANELYLSTNAGDKLFRISVENDGTLHATEVT